MSFRKWLWNLFFEEDEKLPKPVMRSRPVMPLPAPLTPKSESTPWGFTVPAGVIIGVTTAEKLQRQRRDEDPVS